MEAGLMAFWSDITPDYMQRFQQWHNCEHIPERVTSPGFRRGCRYRAMDNRSHFLMFYETDVPDALASDYYLDALNNPTPWTQEALTHFKNPVRNVYSLVETSGGEGPFAAPWITSLRFNAEIAPKGVCARLVSAGDILRARLYEVDEKISRIMTSERKIYGGGPGAQQFLLIVEEALPNAAAKMLAGLDVAISDTFQDSYWLEMSHRKKSGVA